MLVDAHKNNAITPELAEEIKSNHPAFSEDIYSRKTETSPHTDSTRNLDVKNVELFKSLAMANTLKDALTAIKTDLSSKLDEPQKILINRLTNLKKASNAKFVMFDKTLAEITGREEDTRTVGSYNTVKHRVAGFINSDVADILHEGVHAATFQELQRHIEFKPNTWTDSETIRKALPTDHKSKSALGNQLLNIYDRAIQTSFDRARETMKPGDQSYKWTPQYGFTDMHEFIAEAFTNKRFQEYLGTIPSITKNKDKSVWDDFIRLVREMLNLPPSTETLLDDIITISDPLFKGKRGKLDQFIDKIRGRDTELRSEQGEIKPITIVDKGNAIKVVNSWGDTIKNLPGGSQEIYEGARNALSKVPTGAKKVALAFMSLPNKIELYGNRLPQLKSLLNNLEQRASKADQLRSEVDKLVFKGVNLIKKYPKSVVDKFNKVTLQLSAENIDPRKKYADGTTNPDYDPNNPLVKAYESLPKPLYDLGIEYTEQYEKYSRDMLEIIKDILGVKEKNNKVGIALSQRFESKRLKFYHPLRRKGDYWLSYNDKDGELVVISRGSPREIEEAMKLATQQGATDLKRYNKLQDINYKNAPPVGFVKDVINVLDDKLKNTLLTAEAKDGIKNQIYQTYLDLLPAEALRQQFRHREGIPGYIEDVVGGYADTGAKLANQLANMEYRIKIDSDLADMKVRLEELQGAPDSEELTAVVQDIYKQKQFLDNPVADSISSRLSWVSYMWNIAGNVSSALVNITQIPMVVFPMLAGKYGYAKAMKVLSDAYSTYTSGDFDDNRQFFPDYTFGKNAKLSPGHRRLYEAAIKQAAIRRGVGYELSEMRRTTAEDFTGRWAKVETFLGWTFQNSERMNREVTLLAAYDLAIQDGKTEEQAIQEALDLTMRAHSHALSEAGPEMFQTGIGKVAFTFKRFAQAQIYNVARLFYQSVKKFNPDDETRKLAQKQLTGILGMTYVFSGAQGLPLYGAANMFTSALAAMFGDDDEPYDFDESVRSAIGDLGYKGPINALTNVDIASRTGFNGMVWRDDPRRLSEVGFTSYFAEHFFGPAFQVGVNVERGAKLLNEGHSYRALETVLPTALRNPLKAMRFANEGALTTNGAPIVDDVNAMSAFLQIFGFSNAELTEAYTRASAMKTAEQKIQARRTALLDLHFLAKSNGDLDMMSELRDKISAYNDANPSYKISGDTLARSYRGHMQRIHDSVDGVYLNKKLKRKLIEEYGE
ncbi:PLxRFG domain-containing protein [bacterium]|nr:PLxRFG domain-containing protein [bacterium]